MTVRKWVIVEEGWQTAMFQLMAACEDRLDELPVEVMAAYMEAKTATHSFMRSDGAPLCSGCPVCHLKVLAEIENNK